MTSQARIRLVTEGVVASYIHDISARAHTTDMRSRDDAVLAADHGYSVFIPYHGTRKAAHRPKGAKRTWRFTGPSSDPRSATSPLW